MTGEAVALEGSVIAGKYLVGPILGEGGMGVVVAATHLQLDQPVALKFLRPEALRSQEIVVRFAREARAAAKIQSQHVVRILDVGALDSGAPYMVMERLEGEDLSRTLARRAALPIADAIDYVLQACEAVAQAHALDMVHRDLKPANLFLARRPGGKPIVKVLDFGISKLPTSMDSVSLTRTTGFIGSPPYMSPEQLAASRSVDARSDIWSLGIVLYELLTKRTPFEGQSMPVMIASILHQAPDPPRLHRPDLPRELDAAILRCLRQEPAERFSDVAALAAAIGGFGSRSSAESVERIARTLHVRQPTTALTAVSDDEAAPREDQPGATGPPVEARPAEPVPSLNRPRTRSKTAPPTRAQTRRDPRRGILVVLAAVGVVAIGGGVAGTWWTMRQAPRTTAGGALGERKPESPAAPAREPAPPRRVAPPVPETPSPTAAATPSPAAPAEPPPREVVAEPPPKAIAARPKAPAVAPRSASARAPVSREATAEPTVAPAAGRTPRPGKAPASPECARLLERQSLGETLSAADAALYTRQCRR